MPVAPPWLSLQSALETGGKPQRDRARRRRKGSTGCSIGDPTWPGARRPRAGLCRPAAQVDSIRRCLPCSAHFSSCRRLRAYPSVMESTANTSTFVSEPVDARQPPSSPASATMQNEDFAQFTSFMDACLRAIEDRREDRLIHDPFAESLTRQIMPQLAPRLKKWEEQQPHPEDYVALRGRYLDEALAQRNPGIRQVVILGAGLDTRVFRLKSLTGCHVLEIDQSAELFEHKRAVLKELKPKLLVERHDYVVADLNAFNWEEGLLSSGFDPDIPTFWVLEGIMMYLTRASNLALLKTIDVLSAPGSEIWGDMISRVLAQDDVLPLFRDVNELYKKELGEELFKHGEEDISEGVFSELPWELEVQAALEEKGTHFNREWTPTLTKSDKQPVTYNFVLAKKPLAGLP